MSDDKKTFAQVKRELQNAVHATLYSDGSLVFVQEHSIRVRGKRTVEVVQVWYRVSGFLKNPANRWTTNYGGYDPFLPDVEVGRKNRPLRLDVRHECIGLLALGRPEYVEVYLNNNSEKVDKLELENRSVSIKYVGSPARIEVSYLARRNNHPMWGLDDTVVSAGFAVNWDRRREYPDDRTYDQDWVMDDYEAA